MRFAALAVIRNGRLENVRRIEAGGTKFVCVIGTGPAAIVATKRIEVADPARTISATRNFFIEALDEGMQLDAIGIGSFGPVELRHGHPRYGYITTTPKAGWSGTDMVGPFASGLGVPIEFDTDVNAAALAEGRWGAARGLRSFIYLTLGTGVGGGAVVDGRLVHGLGHPEMGHISVQRRAGDVFAGVCPFHGDCFEGMASGTAVAARFGRPAEALEGADRDAAISIIAFYLAVGARSLVYALAPERIVVGGGLSAMPGLAAAARAELVIQLAGYPGLPEHGEPAFLEPAALGNMAGPLGTLILADRPQRRRSRGRGVGRCGRPPVTRARERHRSNHPIAPRRRSDRIRALPSGSNSAGRASASQFAGRISPDSRSRGRVGGTESGAVAPSRLSPPGIARPTVATHEALLG